MVISPSTNRKKSLLPVYQFKILSFPTHRTEPHKQRTTIRRSLCYDGPLNTLKTKRLKSRWRGMGLSKQANKGQDRESSNLENQAKDKTSTIFHLFVLHFNLWSLLVFLKPIGALLVCWIFPNTLSHFPLRTFLPWCFAMILGDPCERITQPLMAPQPTGWKLLV